MEAYWAARRGGQVIAFELFMPGVGSWDGRWSGSERSYVIVRSVGRGSNGFAKEYDIVSNSPYRYDFGDGWAASVSARAGETAGWTAEGLPTRKERHMNLDNAKTIKLRKGAQEEGSGAGCVMQVVALLDPDRDEWTDRPACACACPGLTAFLIPLNDWMTNEERQPGRRSRVSDLTKRVREIVFEYARLEADLARLTREKETCPICGHLWRQHDPEDGKCDAHSAEGIGVCKCGRSIEFHQRKHADLSRRFLSVDDLSERLDTPRISTFVSVGADDDDGGRDAR
jgi:hypothetical protein